MNQIKRAVAELAGWLVGHGIDPAGVELVLRVQHEGQARTLSGILRAERMLEMQPSEDIASIDRPFRRYGVTFKIEGQRPSTTFGGGGGRASHSP